MTDDTLRSGTCLCGSVRISVATANNHIGACHCSMCRKWGGGPLLALEVEAKVGFEGEENIALYSSSDWAERGFCRQCGTHLFYRLKQAEHYAIPVGLLDGGDSWQLTEQIFIDAKPAFYSFSQHTKNLTGEEVFAQFSGQ